MGKKIKAKELKPKDIELFLCLSKVGMISSDKIDNKENRKNYFDTNINTNQINKYINCNYIIKESYENNYYYRLTSEGRNFCKKQVSKLYDDINLKHPYRWQSYNHCSKIEDKYFSLTENEQSTWKSEEVLKYEFDSYLREISDRHSDNYDFSLSNEIKEMISNHQLSTCDCSYVSESGIEILYEATTNSYGNLEIEQKINYSNVMNMTLIMN